MLAFPIVTTAIAVGFITYTIGRVANKMYKIAKRVGHLEQRVSSLRLLNDNGNVVALGPYRGMPTDAATGNPTIVISRAFADDLNQLLREANDLLASNNNFKIDILRGRFQEMIKRIEAETHVQ